MYALLVFLQFPFELWSLKDAVFSVRFWVLHPFDTSNRERLGYNDEYDQVSPFFIVPSFVGH